MANSKINRLVYEFEIDGVAGGFHDINIDLRDIEMTPGGQLFNTSGTYDGAYFFNAILLRIGGGSNTRDGSATKSAGVGYRNGSIIVQEGTQETFVASLSPTISFLHSNPNVIIRISQPPGVNTTTSKNKLFVDVYGFGWDGVV